MRAALVLMYHQIVPDLAPADWVPSPLADPRYGVREGEFARQMAHLRREGYEVLSLEALVSGGDSSLGGSPERPAVAITFDDGYESDFTRAAPVLATYGLPATFFVTTGQIGRPGMMTEAMVAELSARPALRVGAHGESHRFLSALPEEECRGELLRSFSRIRQLTGRENVSMSAPGGRTDARVARLAREAGFCLLATSAPGLHPLPGDPFSVPRLPVLGHHPLGTFASLLDPSSLAHRRERWMRLARQRLRSLLRRDTMSAGG